MPIHYMQHCIRAQVTTGVGAAIGAAMGGCLYDFGKQTPLGAFMLPMVVACILPLTVLPLVFYCFGDQRNEEGGIRTAVRGGSSVGSDDGGNSIHSGERGKREQRVSRACTLLSLAFSAMLFEGINPLLEPHLAPPPFRMSVPEVCI